MNDNQGIENNIEPKKITKRYYVRIKKHDRKENWNGSKEIQLEHLHNHNLIFTDNLPKSDTDFPKYRCDVEDCKYWIEQSYRCQECDFDLCLECYDKLKNTTKEN
jgi:hypothetical protein